MSDNDQDCPTCRHPDGIPPEHLAFMRANAANPEVRARFAANVAAQNEGPSIRGEHQTAVPVPRDRPSPTRPHYAPESEHSPDRIPPMGYAQLEYDSAGTPGRQTPRSQPTRTRGLNGVLHLRLHTHNDLPSVGTRQVMRQLVPSKGELGEFQMRRLIGDQERDIEFDLPKKRSVHRPLFDGNGIDEPESGPLKFPFGGAARRQVEAPSPAKPYGPGLPVDGKLFPEFRRLLGLPDPDPDPWRPREGRAEGWHPLDVRRDPLPKIRPGTGALGPWPVSPLPPIGLWGGTPLAEPATGFGLTGGLWIKLPGGFRIYVGGSGTFAKRRVFGGWEIGGGIQWRS